MKDGSTRKILDALKSWPEGLMPSTPMI